MSFTLTSPPATATSTTTTTTTASSSSLLLPFSSSLHAKVAGRPALAHLSPADRQKFASYGFAPRRKVDIPVVHHGFERQARLQPDVVAVEHSLHNHSLTYAQLDRKANRLARRLRYDHGIKPGTRVCILTCRSIYYVVAVIAVLKAGGQYVPLDGVTVTDATLQHVLSDSGADLCLVMREYHHRVGVVTPALVIEDAMDEDERTAACADKPEDLSSPDDGAYVIYTSGTTGKPKGVDVRHRGVTNGTVIPKTHVFPRTVNADRPFRTVISGSPGNVGMRPGMRVAQLLNIAFDMGAWECLSALYNGCTLCLRGNTSKEWAALLKTVDVVISTPSILTRHDPADYPTIKHVIVGGEPCPQGKTILFLI
jgi:non-ribosomal peptide synthetase component F